MFSYPTKTIEGEIGGCGNFMTLEKVTKDWIIFNSIINYDNGRPMMSEK